MKNTFVSFLLLTAVFVYGQGDEIKSKPPEDSKSEKKVESRSEITAKNILKGSTRIELYKYNDKSSKYPYATFSSDIINVNYGFMPGDDRKLSRIIILYRLPNAAINTSMTSGIKTEGKGIEFSKLLSSVEKEFGEYKKEKRKRVLVYYNFKDKDGNKIQLMNNTRSNFANLSFTLNSDKPAKKQNDPISFFGPDRIPIFKGPVTFEKAIEALKRIYSLDKTDESKLSASIPSYHKTLDFYKGKGSPCLRVYLPIHMIKDFKEPIKKPRGKKKPEIESKG